MSRRYLFAICCLGMLSFGIVLTTLGASLPNVIARFGIDKGQAGSLLALMSFGILAGSMAFGPIVDRRGYKAMLLLALAAIAIGLEAIAFAPSLGWLRVAVLLIGVGGGIVNGGANALVADVSAGGRGAGLSLLGVFFGIGAAGVPFVLSALADIYSHAAILAVIGALVLVPFALTAAGRFPAAKQPHGFPLADARALLSDGVLLLMGLMLFLESGMEISVGGWTATLFVDELNVGADRALGYLSLYWLGMMLARLAVGFILRRESAVRVLLAGIGIAFAGALLLVSTRSVPVAATGVFLLGAGFAGTFPIVLGFVGDRYAQLSGTAFSLVIVMALVGGMLLPYATGVLGARYGLRASLVIVPAALVLLVAILAAVRRQVVQASPERSLNLHHD
jgi:MFS transporter, FHS family, glucose/mannose:H+ symporter